MRANIKQRQVSERNRTWCHRTFFNMRILGISELAASIDFKRVYCPGADEREYLISQDHGSAAALVISLPLPDRP
jgi:hypothetical protein